MYRHTHLKLSPPKSFNTRTYPRARKNFIIMLLVYETRIFKIGDNDIIFDTNFFTSYANNQNYNIIGIFTTILKTNRICIHPSKVLVATTGFHTLKNFRLLQFEATFPYIALICLIILGKCYKCFGRLILFVRYIFLKDFIRYLHVFNKTLRSKIFFFLPVAKS